MADQYQNPYLDSSVFIAWIKGEVINNVKRGEIARHVLNKAREGLYKIHTSSLTLVEVHKKRHGPILTGEEDDSILNFFENDFINLIDVDRAIGEEANKLCQKHAILPNDAIHLACAIRASCDVFLLWDRPVSKISHPYIRIEEPSIIGQSELYSEQ